MNLRRKLVADYYLGGIGHVLLKPFVMLLGRILRRDHSLTNLKELAVIKMLGGGSIIIAYPSLLALKKKYPHLKLKLITTPGIHSFAEITGLFDEIIIIRDDNLLHLIVDAVKAVHNLWRIRALLDLEIHSRFSAIFSLLTCAVNRIGIYTDLSYWRKSLYTHLLFYNKYSPIYSLYDQVVNLLGVENVDVAGAKIEFQAQIGKQALGTPDFGKTNIGIAPGCSDYGRERMLSEEHWIEIMTARLSRYASPTVHFIGSKSDQEFADKIIFELKKSFPLVGFDNCCGRLPLINSIALIGRLEVLYCIDSSLIHFSHLLDIKTVSFWGPTDPRTRLRPETLKDVEANYAALACSPCIHITLETPCYGNNICMKASLDPKQYSGAKNPIWLAKG